MKEGQFLVIAIRRPETGQRVAVKYGISLDVTRLTRPTGMFTGDGEASPPPGTFLLQAVVSHHPGGVGHYTTTCYGQAGDTDPELLHFDDNAVYEGKSILAARKDAVLLFYCRTEANGGSALFKPKAPRFV